MTGSFSGKKKLIWICYVGVQNGNSKEGLDPKAITFVCEIDACGSREMLEKAKKIHALVSQSRFAQDLDVVNVLIRIMANAGDCMMQKISTIKLVVR